MHQKPLLCRPTARWHNTALLLTLAAILLVCWWFRAEILLSDSAKGEPQPAVTVPTSPRATAQQAADPPTIELPVAMQELPAVADDQKFADYLQQRFGPFLQHPKARLQLLEKLLAYLSQQPDHNSATKLQVLLAEFLQQHFPAFSDLLIGDLNNLLGYYNRMQDERHSLAVLSGHQRQARVWQIREEFFGAQAQQIWLDQWQTQQFAEALTNLNAQELSWPDKTAEFINATKEFFGGTNPRYLPGKQQELVTQLMSMSSIQQQLQQLDSAQQLKALTAMRRDLGMDDAALSRWQVLDKTRKARRDKGNEYMQRRAQILISSVSEENKSLLMRALREELFAEEAAIIAAEEQRSYLRFAEPQIIGVN